MEAFPRPGLGPELTVQSSIAQLPWGCHVLVEVGAVFISIYFASGMRGPFSNPTVNVVVDKTKLLHLWVLRPS